MGSSILFSYPEIVTIAGVQGSITYAACSALPLMIFPVLAPTIRRKIPEGFILTMWVSERFGVTASLYLSFLTWVFRAIPTLAGKPSVSVEDPIPSAGGNTVRGDAN